MIVASCVGDDPTLRPGPDAGAGASKRPPSERPTTRPQRPRRARVQLEATGRARGLIATGIADVKGLGLWDDLTDHLYVVRIDSRLGRLNVPEDGHLADTYFTGVIDERGAGALCDIMFFPTAVEDDLARWETYYAEGRIADAPPTLRAFYGSLVAHELAHCALGARGEPAAQAWEKRVRLAVMSQT